MPIVVVRPAVDFSALEAVLVVDSGADEARAGDSGDGERVKALGVLIAVALALALQTTLARLLVGGTAAIDLVLVAVVAVALTTGPVGGMLAGSVAGLIQDSLSTGVLGIGGLAKSVDRVSGWRLQPAVHRDGRAAAVGDVRGGDGRCTRRCSWV